MFQTKKFFGRHTAYFSLLPITMLHTTVDNKKLNFVDLLSFETRKGAGSASSPSISSLFFPLGFEIPEYVCKGTII